MHAERGNRGASAKRQLVLEPLEQRLLLNSVGSVFAGVVGGDLVIIGDEGNNKIDIYRDGSSVVVMGTEGTSLNGVADGMFYAPLPLGNINISMNGGYDDVDIYNLGFGGNINYEGGTGNDRFRLRYSGILGRANVDTGLDFDQVWLEDVGIGGNVSISTGRQEDFVRVLDSGFARNLSIVSSHDDGEVDIDSIRVRGNLLVDGGQGDLAADIGSEFDPGALVGGSLTVRTDDYLDLGIGHSVVRNGINVMAGRWDAEIGLLDVATTNLGIQTQNALPGQSPGVLCALGDIRLAGSLSFAAGESFWGTLVVQEGVMRGNLSVLWEDLDGGEAEVLISDVVVGGSAQVTGNQGGMLVGISGLASGGSVGVQGNFLTSVEAQYIAARGNFNVDFGPGLLEFGLDEAVLGGSLNVSGAGGIEFMEITDSRMRGNANIDTGDGSVQAAFGGLLIGGNMNLTNGTGAVANYGAEAVVVLGSLNLDSNALFTDAELGVAVRGNVNIQTGLGGDEVILVYSAVRGSTTIRTDGGEDQVFLLNSLLNGNVLVDTGGNGDFVGLATIQADESDGPLQINGSLTVRTGAGDDGLGIGAFGGTGETGVFNGPVFLDGGPGNDGIAIEVVNTFAQVPTVVNFEFNL